MKLEDNIFSRYLPDFKTLLSFGFVQEDSIYTLKKLFKDNEFRAELEITAEGKVSGKVYEVENDEEFLPLRVENNEGAFVGEVRFAYENLLLELREKCFVKKYFVLPQANRIAGLILEKYGNEPEFLWKTAPGSGVIRNSETKKWYIAFLEVNRSKLQPKQNELVEVANVKLAPEKVQKLLKQKNFYPAYHMNKISWLSIILDDSVSDDEIMELVEESHNFTVKKN